jgi:predicted transcriptional regulator
MAESALERLQESGVRTLPVIHAGQLIGLITSENITEFLIIRSALQSTRGAPTV